MVCGKLPPHLHQNRAGEPLTNASSLPTHHSTGCLGNTLRLNDTWAPESSAGAHVPTRQADPSPRGHELTGLLLIAPPTARAALGLPASAANCW